MPRPHPLQFFAFAVLCVLPPFLCVLCVDAVLRFPEDDAVKVRGSTPGGSSSRSFATFALMLFSPVPSAKPASREIKQNGPPASSAGGPFEHFVLSRESAALREAADVALHAALGELELTSAVRARAHESLARGARRPLHLRLRAGLARSWRHRDLLARRRGAGGPRARVAQRLP